MKVGLVPAFAGGVVASGTDAGAFVRAVETNGFESLWVGEHIVLPVHQRVAYPGAREGLSAPSDAPLPDPLEWLAFVAGRSDTLLLGTAILLATLHHPLTLAKRVATLDQLSGGRVRLGVGIGWNEQEYEAVSVPFAHRGARLEEYLAALRVLWREDQAEFAGTFVRFEPVYSSPKPVGGSVPILIGGNSEAAARRAGRIGDGYFPFERDQDRLTSLVTVMRRAATDAGRDPDTIEITSLGSTRPDSVTRLVQLGVQRMIVFLPGSDVAAVDAIGDRCRSAGADMTGPAS